jgi:hypothetical protein
MKPRFPCGVQESLQQVFRSNLANKRAISMNFSFIDTELKFFRKNIAKSLAKSSRQWYHTINPNEGNESDGVSKVQRLTCERQANWRKGVGPMTQWTVKKLPNGRCTELFLERKDSNAPA